MVELLDILGIASIPSACLTAFLNWRLKKLESKIDEKESMRLERDYLLVKGTLASISLGEAQAKELIKDPRYLATINNLSEPVVKTASKTMKVTYTLTEA